MECLFLFGKMFWHVSDPITLKGEKKFLCHEKSDQTTWRSSSSYTMVEFLIVSINAVNFMEFLKYTRNGGWDLEEKLKLLWLILIFVDFGLMFVSFPILIYVIFCMTWIQKAFCKCPFPVKRPEGHLHVCNSLCMYSQEYE